MNDKLYELLSALTHYSVIRAYQNGVQPKKPFITYQLKFEKMPDNMLYSEISSTGEQITLTHIDAVLELQCFGHNGVNLLREIALKAKTPNQIEKWDKEGIAVISANRISNIPFLNEEKSYEDRAILEIDIRYTSSVKDIIHIIETVEIEKTSTKTKNHK